jgi:hypothetical protein
MPLPLRVPQRDKAFRAGSASQSDPGPSWLPRIPPQTTCGTLVRARAQVKAGRTVAELEAGSAAHHQVPLVARREGVEPPTF